MFELSKKTFTYYKYEVCKILVKYFGLFEATEL